MIEHQCAASQLNSSSDYFNHTIEISSVFEVNVDEYPITDFDSAR